MIRWTKEEYLDYLGKKNQDNKYKNIRVTYDGIHFPSKLERDVYIYYKRIAKSEEIEKIERQVPFVILDGFKKNGKTYRPVVYKADFVLHYKDGRKEVIDAKGKRTELFNLKKKLFEKRYPDLTIKIVTREDV